MNKEPLSKSNYFKKAASSFPNWHLSGSKVARQWKYSKSSSTSTSWIKSASVPRLSRSTQNRAISYFWWKSYNLTYRTSTSTCRCRRSITWPNYLKPCLNLRAKSTCSRACKHTSSWLRCWVRTKQCSSTAFKGTFSSISLTPFLSFLSPSKTSKKSPKKRARRTRPTWGLSLASERNRFCKWWQAWSTSTTRHRARTSWSTSRSQRRTCGLSTTSSNFWTRTNSTRRLYRWLWTWFWFPSRCQFTRRTTCWTWTSSWRLYNSSISPSTSTRLHQLQICTKRTQKSGKLPRWLYTASRVYRFRRTRTVRKSSLLLMQLSLAPRCFQTSNKCQSIERRRKRREAARAASSMLKQQQQMHQRSFNLPKPS